jgi:PAS domain S-box-containing protein
VLTAAGYLLAFMVLNLLALAFETSHNVSNWYPPPGLTLAVLLTLGLSYAPVTFVAVVISHTFIWRFDMPLAAIALMALVVMAGYGLAAYVLQRALPGQGERIDRRLQGLRSLTWFVGVSMVASGVVTALSIAVLTAGGVIPRSAYVPATLDFWVGDAIGIVTLAPFLLTCGFPWLRARVRRHMGETHPPPEAMRPSFDRDEVLSIAGAGAILLLVLWLAFGSPVAGQINLFYLCFLPIMWIALRHGLQGAALGALLISVGILLSASAYGFQFANRAEVQILLLSVALVGLYLGAVTTARERAERALQESKARLRRLIESTQDLIYLQDLEGRYQYYNGPHRYGLEPDDVVGTTPYDWHPPEVAAKMMARLQQVAATGEPITAEQRVEWQGTTLWFLDDIFPVYDDDGNVVTVGYISRNITQRKQAEIALRESEETYRRLVEGSPNILYIYSDRRGARYWSQRIQEVLGYAPTDLIDAPYRWHDAIHPDDIAAVDAVIADPDKGAGYSFEYRVQDTDGRWHWFHDQFISRRRVGDEVILEGLATDITERKRAEMALRESEERFRKVFDTESVAIAVSRRRDGMYLEANPGFLKMTGYDYNEIIGHTSRTLKFFSPAQRRALVSRIADQGHLYNQELTFPTKSGELRTVLFSIGPITLSDEACLVATMVDVTERKRMEAALERRIVALTRPLDDAAPIDFEALFNLDEIQHLQDEFAEATGVASLITQPDGTPITQPSNFCRLCRDIIRQTEKGRANCYTSDAIVGRSAPDAPTVQPCKSGGLWDAGASIYVGGNHVANWLIGQVRDATQTEDQIRAYAREIGADEVAAVAAFWNVPAMSREQFGRVAQALFTLANQLSTMAYQNVQQARFITERKRAETALQESEASLAKAQKIAHVGSWDWDVQGETLTWSDETYRIFGLEKGVPLTYEDIAARIHPDDRERNEAFVNTLLTQADTADVEFRIIRPEGTVRHIYQNAEVQRDESGTIQRVFGIMQDITERKRAEKALRKSEERFRTIVDALPQFVAYTDKDLVYRFVNQTYQQKFNVTPEEVVGKTLPEVIGEEAFEEARPHVELALQGEQVRYHERYDYAIGGTRDIDGILVPDIAEDGDVRGYYAVLTDITPYMELQHELRQTTARLRIQHAIDTAILTAQSSEEIARAALARLDHLVPCRQASIAEIDVERQRGRDLIVLIDGDLRAKTPDWHPLTNAGDLVTALREGRSHIVPDLATLATPAPLEEMLAADGMRAYVSVPLIVRGALVGSLNLASDTPDAFQPEHLEILEEVAASLAVALQQARLLEQTRQDATTKGLLLQEVNHRVKNNLDAIIGLLYVERRHAPPEALPAYRPIMQDLTQRITSLAQVHQMLSEAEWAPLNLGQLATHIIRTTTRGVTDEVDVQLDVAPTPVHVPPAQAHHLALILSELTTNTLKHAADDGARVRITVQIAEKDGIITLTYRNDGPGYPEDVLRLERHSAGLDIIKRSVRKNLRGDLALRNDGGAVTEIRFKRETQ